MNNDLDDLTVMIAALARMAAGAKMDDAAHFLRMALMEALLLKRAAL